MRAHDREALSLTTMLAHPACVFVSPRRSVSWVASSLDQAEAWVRHLNATKEVPNTLNAMLVEWKKNKDLWRCLGTWPKCHSSLKTAHSGRGCAIPASPRCPPAFSDVPSSQLPTFPLFGHFAIRFALLRIVKQRQPVFIPLLALSTLCILELGLFCTAGVPLRNIPRQRRPTYDADLVLACFIFVIYFVSEI